MWLAASHTCTPLATGIIVDPYRFEFPRERQLFSSHFDFLSLFRIFPKPRELVWAILFALCLSSLITALSASAARSASSVLACSLRERGVAEDGRDHLACGVTIERRSKPTSPPSRSAAGSSISWRSWIRQAGRCWCAGCHARILQSSQEPNTASRKRSANG